MSSSSSSSSPAPPATSTPPLPGSAPSASPAAGGGAAPAPAAPPSPSPSSSSPTPIVAQPTVEPAIPNQDGATTTTPQKALPGLPAPGQDSDSSFSSSGGGNENGLRTVHVNGQAVALDNLGPMVVGRDGSISRIANWDELTATERQNTLRILGKRNQLRLGNLQAGLPADQKKKEPESS
ncbi:hypothetical protein C8A00DRAFT_32152 [Chaetomidium leptoderma]|uniref:Uncharacterized protein n=1 Tax=Chaetomidium leptoderma TaxID=669021 RepID=A0AAN6VPS3_9PEZI|nr:hypothetical protein C8A00DRAFT_32152 [Chaetomidium leptoderma]